ncbi:unnamed protein product [Macrosiphum euphorbiae]|uniref:YqaJ viral recombinase domain-containing protein n=1 Tax=Macrosiphum euphorbiae TaxID=13131 RepID=A0AAV0XW82_9HEMI|nr:unnamed protein product [Macrosiphum euphorbiae]
MALEGMLSAGKEEGRLAIERGDVDQYGRPKIAVVADGAWSKRSYRTNYNALSGVACIIGAVTKKVIFFGVRNKFCCVCFSAKKHDKGPGPHHFFLNWNGPSTAMEADIIVDRFKHSLEMHNLIYSQLIGDGDSSVMKRLRIAKPYGPNFIIKKVECINHLLRNYINRLRDLTSKRKNSKGERIPGYLRNSIQTRLLRLRNIPYETRLTDLKSDLVNGPNHVFGDHTKCRKYFCQGKKEGENNLVDELKQFELWDDITRARHLLTYHTESLMYNFNNNAAELYNSILAKFIGGKLVNFSHKGSYELRCNAAVTAYNEGANRLSLFNKQITDKSPGMYTKNNIKKKYEDYGNVLHDPFSDLTESQIEEYKREYLDKLSLSKSEIKMLEIRTRQHQCEEWYIERKKRLTASIFGKVCKMRDKTSRAKTVENILFGTFTGNAATRYGIANEIIAKEQLEDLLKQKILPVGLMVDNSMPFIAASPDGILDDESLVEIKCPASANELAPEDAIQNNKIKCCSIKDGQLYLKRNDNYYYQVQGQLQISQKTYCYFCVWTPKGLMYEKIKRDNDFWKINMESKIKTFYLENLLPVIIKENLRQ